MRVLSRLVVPALAFCLAGAVLPGASLAAVGESEAGRMVAETFGVEVLRVRAGEVGGTQVWLITVMNPPGDTNEAFQVNTLAVDRQSGKLVSAFRHKSSGYDLSSDPGRGDRVGRRPDAARSGTWR